jgi:hypothetical protein
VKQSSLEDQMFTEPAKRTRYGDALVTCSGGRNFPATAKALAQQVQKGWLYMHKHKAEPGSDSEDGDADERGLAAGRNYDTVADIPSIEFMAVQEPFANPDPSNPHAHHYHLALHFPGGTWLLHRLKGVLTAKQKIDVDIKVLRASVAVGRTSNLERICKYLQVPTLSKCVLFRYPYFSPGFPGGGLALKGERAKAYARLKKA